MTKELQRHYKTLNVKPTDSAEEIRRAYEYLANAWDVDRFADNPDWRKRAEAKLAEINNAYEAILDAASRGAEDRINDGAPDDPEPPASPSEERRGFAPTKKTALYILAATAAASLVTIGVLVWPTAYDRDGVTSGDRKQTVRTTHPAAERSEKTPAPPPVSKKKIAEKALQSEPEKPAAPPGEWRKAEPSTGAMTEKRPYTVQITALRDTERAKALMHQLKKSGWEAHIAKAEVKGRGVLHRILVGHFATREEALRYMTDKKIRDAYPDSFIQKMIP